MPEKFKPTRGTRDCHIKLRCTRDERDWLQEMAAKHDTSVSDMIRQCVKHARRNSDG